MSRTRLHGLPTAALISLALGLTACNGIEETTPALRLVTLTDGGQTLGYVTSTQTSQTALSGTLTLNPPGLNVDQVQTGRQFLLTTPQEVQLRGLDLQPLSTFTAPPFTPCFTKSALNAVRDRLLVLSECSGNGQLALYRTDGSLVWKAQLPTNLVTIPGTDAPPTVIAAWTADNAVVSRADITGQSEVILVTPRRSGDPFLDLDAVVSTPVSTVKIYDLAPFENSVYAATDSGIRALVPATGLPDAAAPLAAFGGNRYDRLWSGTVGNRTLLAAWRSNILSGNGSEALMLWSGQAESNAVQVSTFTDLRDVSIALDGRLYALTSTTLSSYDTVLGLAAQRNWSPLTHLTGLKDARALTWVVEDTAP